MFRVVNPKPLFVSIIIMLMIYLAHLVDQFYQLSYYSRFSQNTLWIDHDSNRIKIIQILTNVGPPPWFCHGGSRLATRKKRKFNYIYIYIYKQFRYYFNYNVFVVIKLNNRNMYFILCFLVSNNTYLKHFFNKQIHFLLINQ